MERSGRESALPNLTKYDCLKKSWVIPPSKLADPRKGEHLRAEGPRKGEHRRSKSIAPLSIALSLSFKSELALAARRLGSPKRGAPAIVLVSFAFLPAC